MKSYPFWLKLACVRMSFKILVEVKTLNLNKQSHSMTYPFSSGKIDYIHTLTLGRGAWVC